MSASSVAVFPALLVAAISGVVAATACAIGYYIRYLHRRLHTDDLTGLGNRLMLHRLMQRAHRYRWRRTMAGMVMLDLDRFKQINDTHGHTAATVLLLLGIPERVVMDIIGWSSSAMAKRYQHVTAELRRNVAMQVGGYLWGDK